MATATTNNHKTTTETPEIAQKIREQLISTVTQGQKLSVDAAQTWVKAVSVLPVPDLPKIPGIPAVPGVETATTFVFDLAADLLQAQREYALQLVSVFATAKSA
jgi:hypothetical protein